VPQATKLPANIKGNSTSTNGHISIFDLSLPHKQRQRKATDLCRLAGGPVSQSLASGELLSLGAWVDDMHAVGNDIIRLRGQRKL
jgi:hypothetical protein